MLIEEKSLSPTETLLFFSNPLPVEGTFLYTNNIKEELQLLENLADEQLHKTLLLTSDFIYINSLNEQTFDDLKTLTLAEIDDFINSSPSLLLAPKTNLDEKIKLILKTIVAPFLQKDGGDIEFINFEHGTVKVKFLGKCNGCPYASNTLKNRVEKNLIRYLPQVREAELI